MYRASQARVPELEKEPRWWNYWLAARKGEKHTRVDPERLNHLRDVFDQGIIKKLEFHELMFAIGCDSPEGWRRWFKARETMLHLFGG